MLDITGRVITKIKNRNFDLSLHRTTAEIKAIYKLTN